MKKYLFVFVISLIVSVTVQAAHTTSNMSGTDVFPNDWSKIKLKGLNLLRLKVPNGWLIREGLGKFGGLALNGQERIMIFVPDADYNWQTVVENDWQTLKLKGLNLYRLKLPEGWLVREGYGKIGSENQTQGLLYIDDKTHKWVVQPK
ncbi:MAG: hypothetical protein JKY19_01085 [Alcanivoracaceae bacterium]|nr:hypothetical protein [Alcanivoracaceae bacterium]